MKNVKFPLYVEISEKKELNLQDLSLETAVYLYCLWIITKGRRTLIPSNRKISPCQYSDKLIFNRIIRSQWASVEKGTPNVVKIYSPENYIKEMDLLFDGEDYPINWRENFVCFWKEVALYECINYLEHLFSNQLMDFKIDEKSNSIVGIKTALEYYPTEKIYNILWLIEKDAKDLYENKGLMRNHAAKRAAYMIENKVHEFYENKKSLKNFNFKSFSVLTDVVFYKILKVGADGFAEIPCEAKLFSVTT